MNSDSIGYMKVQTNFMTKTPPRIQIGLMTPLGIFNPEAGEPAAGAMTLVGLAIGPLWTLGYKKVQVNIIMMISSSTTWWLMQAL